MEKNIDLVSTSKKSFWKLSIPLMAFCVFNSIYGIIDMLWISKIGVEAFFAVGISIPIITFIFACGDAVGQGTNSIMSRFIGSGDYKSAYNALIHGIILANAVWFVLVLCLIFAHGILFHLNQADSYILVLDYLAPMVLFAYLFILVNLFSQTLQAEGNSATPNTLIIISYIINIILDPIYIFDFNLGLKGAAYASVSSSFFVFIIILFLYTTGRTKVPLSLRYFKFHTYIFFEIFKVAVPNILNEGIECFCSSFINSMLIFTMGPSGPILYSVCFKLKNLFIAPATANTRALMSVTGHLFGAGKFDQLKDMFKYVIKSSTIILLIVLIVFFVFREYIFGLFSITGMETDIFWIALIGIIYVLAFSTSVHCARMYDGFGKSIYTLIFVIIQVVIQIALIYGLLAINSHANAILISFIVSEVIIAVVFYLFLRHLFSTFEQKYKGKSTVKHFNEDNQNDKSRGIDDEIDNLVTDNAKKVSLKIPLIIALIALNLVVYEIITIPIKTHNYPLILSGVISFIIGAICVYLMECSDNPKLAVVGYAGISILLVVFMGQHGYLAASLFVITGFLVIFLEKIIKTLKSIFLE